MKIGFVAEISTATKSPPVGGDLGAYDLRDSVPQKNPVSPKAKRNSYSLFFAD